MKKVYHAYIIASRRNGTIYTGVTGELMRRTWAHKHNLYKGFTSKYGVHILVWYEAFDYIHDAIQREKNIKKWPRQWKLNLIEEMNPDWRNLYDELNH